MNQELEKPVVKKEDKIETHVSDAKKKVVEDLAGLMNKKTIMLVSIKDLPDALFQSIKKKLRGKAEIKVAKKSLVNFALDHAKNEHLKELEKHVSADTAILFSDDDAFEISGFLADNKVPAKAKIGQEASENINITAGPTDLLPGPDISALSAVGLQPQVQNGKIHIMANLVLVKKGEIISSNKASVLAKLDITPFEAGLEPLVAFSEGKVYTDIKIDKEATLTELADAYSHGLAFAVELGYPSGETIGYLIGKAGGHEGALDGLVKTEPSPTGGAGAGGGKAGEAEKVNESEKGSEEDSDNKSEDDVTQDSLQDSNRDLSGTNPSAGSSEDKKEDNPEQSPVEVEKKADSGKGEVKEVPSAHELAEKKEEDVQENKSDTETK